MQCPATLNTAEDTAVALDLPTLSPESSLGRSFHPDCWLSILNCVNPSNLTSDRVGSIVTVTHWGAVGKPSDLFRSQWRSANKGVWSVRWRLICVYVPEGTTINRPFPDYAPGQSAFTLYEPNQNVLGSGTWLEGGAYRQTNNQATVMNAEWWLPLVTQIPLLVIICVSAFLCLASSIQVTQSVWSSGCRLLLVLCLLWVLRTLPSV